MNEFETQRKGLSQKDARDKCWKGRDEYFQCMEANNEDQSKCKAERDQFENVCSAVWVKHFINRREQELKKKRFERQIQDMKLK